MDKKTGIIDLGSNSVRLVIYEVRNNGAYRLVDDISDTIRLSENMLDGKYLNDFAMRKAIKTVKLFVKLCTAYGIQTKDIVAVATEAVRKAANKDQFLTLLNNSTGLHFRVLTGEEEALYVYKAVVQTIDINSGIIVDIGGGSTEIIRYENKNIIGYASIPLGAVVATENFIGKDIISDGNIMQFEQHIMSILQQHPWVFEGKSPVIIGLGGTIRNLAKVHRRHINYPLDINHNYSIDINDFYEIFNSLKSIDLEARKKIKGMSVKRADITVGGLAILKAIAYATSGERLVISGNGLREGILFEHISQNRKTKRFRDVLSFSLENYIDLYDIRRDHAEHVCNLSLSMFDQLKALHKLGLEERKLLKVASLLHDIGITIGYYGHNSHSFYMIMNSRLSGLSHREIILVAAIAASHGKDKLKDDWMKEYSGILKKEDSKVFRQLSMLLRMAECLDRSETGIIQALECLVSKDAVKIKTYCDGDAELELNLVNENMEDFRKLFKKSLVVM